MSSLRNSLRAARTALKAGKWQRARGLFEQVLALDARHPEALAGVGTALVRAGAIDEALGWYARALSVVPQSPELLHGLGLAELAARKLAASNDLRLRGERLLAEGRSEEACNLLAGAALQAPDDWRTQQALGQAWLQDGRLQAAQRSLEQSLRLNRSNARARLWLADVFSAEGRREAAESALRDAIGVEPQLGQAWLRLAHLRRFERDDDSDLARMLALASGQALAPTDQEALEFALGKAYDDLGRADEAFAHLERAHALAKHRQPFDTGALLGLMDRIASVCDHGFFSRLQGLGSDSELPVFVVGLPRCGSTLVEQIIASHPRAYGVGELRALPRLSADLPGLLATRTPFPECLRELGAETISSVAAKYLERLRRDAPADVLRVCDKMLSNLLLIGLIAVLFPNARLIHVKRQLMDLALSIYLHSFSGTGVGYAHDLDDIGRYYRKSEELIAHFKREAPIRIIELEYEQLVRDKEAGVRGLIDAVGLDWDPRCLESHRAERQVRTVSNWQVREPIHQRSVARWRRYEEKLAPLRKYLDHEP